MSAKDEVVKHYIDQDGLVTVDRDPSKWSTGNGLMHLGLFATMLMALKQASYADACDVDEAFENCMKAPGIYNRNPGREDLIAHDDLIGVAAGSLAISSSLRTDYILTYGLKHFLFWNNTKTFTINAFRGRALSFMLFILSANSFFVRHLFKPFAWLLFKFSNPTDYHVMLNYMMLEALAKKSPMFKKLRDEKVKTMGLSSAISAYFGVNHPLVEMAQQVEYT